MASSHVETSSVETTADARFDFITKLADLNLLIVIEHIVQHAGYDATLNMLCVSKAWNEILLDIGLWRRLLERRVIHDRGFRRLCSLNGWSDVFLRSDVKTKDLAYIFFASTDLKDVIKRYKSVDFFYFFEDKFLMQSNTRPNYAVF